MIDYRRILTAGLVISGSSSPRLVAAQTDPVDHQVFADELTTRLYEKDNECSSALGVSMAFSLVYPGCEGDAIEQMGSVFGFEDNNMQLVWGETTQRLLNTSDGRCTDGWKEECYSSAPLIKIANSVWFDDGDTLDPNYNAVVGSYAKQIDFAADESPVIVNDWVANSTNGLIESIVPEDKPLWPPYVLLAINSIYLKASWDETFKNRYTNVDTFYSSASRSTVRSEAHFMHMVEKFKYSHLVLPGYQVVSLPFAESQMSMLFVLPQSDGGEAVSSSDVISAFDKLEYTRLALSLPKFKFTSEYSENLVEALKDMGLVSPFQEGSGSLCGLFEDKTGCDQIIIDKVIQKTVIEVNEKGVEAAAVTAIKIVGTSAEIPSVPTLMMLDHPFQFFIYDKSENLMLFEGRLGSPEIPETQPENMLDAKHSDKDFWLSNFRVQPLDIGSGNSDSPTTHTSQPNDSSGRVWNPKLLSLPTCLLLAFAVWF